MIPKAGNRLFGKDHARAKCQVVVLIRIEQTLVAALANPIVVVMQ
jgi:hypothetical protein